MKNMKKKFKYRKLEFDEENVNDLGSEGWRVISVLGSSVIMEKESTEEKEQIINSNQNIMPVARTISDPGALYRCMDKVKRYDWNDEHYESTEFLTIDEFKNEDFYTDDGEYEAFLSDGFYFLGTDISVMNEDELDRFIEKNKSKFLCPDQLKVYYIDYPEDK
jgi:hypothetical protein